jgi:hypothetical protein
VLLFAHHFEELEVNPLAEVIVSKAMDRGFGA